MAQYNFCAIQVGDAAGSDDGLAELLCIHVPRGARPHILQSDASVSRETIDQVRSLLAKLEIEPASSEPLIANDQRAWEFLSLVPLAPVSAGGSPGGAIDNNPLADAPRRVDNSGAIEATLRRMKEIGGKTFKLHQEQQTLHALLARLEGMRPAPRRVEPQIRAAIRHAFNELQVEPHWQKVAGTQGAKRLCEVLDRIRTNEEGVDEQVQEKVELLLQILLFAMRGDAAMLQSVLNAASRLPAGVDSKIAVSKMYVAYMEHSVAVGELDAKPLVALQYARGVQRYTLLKAICQELLASVRVAAGYSALHKFELCTLFDNAMIDVLLDGGKQAPSFEQDSNPAADDLRTAWYEMIQRGSEGFRDFLAEWAPWQALMRRRSRPPSSKRMFEPIMN
ncbi:MULTISPECIES: NEL-type E3 ubiquitin ligase domain-containing protein [unclassified Variovorax]|uniref:NEL-type E3 ubiquitin ligase domain-containing protein n=1 Tax=unclassified Variovorax TaxID=663243 RepID=UPI00083874C6|nr:MULTISPECIES: NEL-type E3 ubiquitin ligase domain-containing protein [unclassified Variovorax]